LNLNQLLIGATALAITAAAQAVPNTSNAFQAIYSDVTLGSMPYTVFLPDNYASYQKLPVVLYLHGAGERGNNNYSQWANNVDNLFAATKSAFPAIVIAPQAASGTQWAPINAGDNWGIGAYTNPPGGMLPITNNLQKAMNILDQVSSQYKGDSSKTYITGLSMGGYGTWDAIARFPTKFAAAAPLSGGGNLSSVPTIKDIPIWAYHGIGDGIVPDSGTINMVNALIAAGGSPEATYAGGKGHSGWDEFYQARYGTESFAWYAWDNSQGEFFYQWMFSQTNPVPEPATMGLMAIGAFLLRRRSR
jgi:predicted peptidase